jgi:hypothetical protein
MEGANVVLLLICPETVDAPHQSNHNDQESNEVGERVFLTSSVR